MPGPAHASAAVTHDGYGTVAACLVYGVSVVSPGRTSRPASRPWPVTSAGLVRQAAPAGRRPPANTAAGRARAPISATGSPSATSRSASYRGAAADGAHPAFNQESCRDGQQAVRFGGGNSGASPNIFLQVAAGALNTCTSWVLGCIADRTEAAETWIRNTNGAWAMGWICGSPLFRDGAAGCLEVGLAARRAMPPRRAVPARGGSPGANRLGLVRGGRGEGPAGRVGGGMRRWLPGGV